MKLLFAIKKLDDIPGGAERVLCILTSALAARGHSVTLLSFDDGSGEPFYSLDERVRRIRLSIGDAARPARLAETVARMRALRRTIRAEAPDVVIGFTPSIYVPMAFALVGIGVPLVGSEHNVPDRYSSRRVQTLVTLMAAPLITRFTVLSEQIRQTYPSAIARRMVPITNPVPPLADPPAPEAPRALRILNVGRLVDQKDQATLLRAFAQVAPQHPDWTLRIVGEGILRSELQAMRTAMGLQTRVEIPGASRDIEQEYAGAAIFALSSLFESFGLVTVEAMQHGLPVVAFADCPGTEELVLDGETCLMAPATPDRATSFAKSLDRLMTDEALRHRLGAGGQERVAGKYDPEAICDTWEGLLKSMTSL